MSQQSTSLEIVSGQERALQAPPTLEELVSLFLEAQDVAPASRRTYGRQLRQFLLWLPECGLIEPLSKQSGLVREDLLAYKQALLESGKSARTVSGYLTAVRKFFSWLESNRVYPNVARDIKGARRPKGFAKDILTKEQLRQALDAINTRSSLEGLRDYALFNLLARTGLRTIELHRAQVGDIRQEIHPQQGPIRVLYVQGKGRDSKDDYVVLTEAAYEPLRDYLRSRGPLLPPEAPLFASHSDRSKGQPLSTRAIRAIVKGALRAVGLDDARLTAHSLRHTAITMVVLAGGSLHDAQAMARHKSSTTTEGYFHNLKRLENAAENLIDF